jgi:outer membrane porin, OprD family
MATSVQRFQRFLLVATSACFLLLSGALVEAQEVQKTQVVQPRPGGYDNDLVREPDVVYSTPEADFIYRVYPGLEEQRRQAPAFFRDTDFNLHFRSFYFNRQKADDTYSEAWALGGWIDYSSGWLADIFAIGSRYYMSFPAYAPDDRPGSQLLTPGQGTIGVFGEAWAAFRYKEYAMLKGGRVRIDEGYVNPQDNRMVPNTFEAAVLSGQLNWFQYDVGYLWTIKPRDSNDFIAMSRQAGASGEDGEGLILSTFAFTPIKDLALYVGNYYGLDTYNTVFPKGEYKFALAPDVTLQVGLQYTGQRSVGDQRIGDFKTWNVGAGARLLWRGLSFGVATHFTGDDANIRQDYGGWPGYLSLQVTDFDRANEKAFGFGLKYDFGGTLLPFKVPGFSVGLLYGQGNDRIDPTTGAGLPTTREGDLDIIYNFPMVKGLSFRFRAAFVDQGGPEVVKDFRIIVNYELNVL